MTEKYLQSFDFFDAKLYFLFVRNKARVEVEFCLECVFVYLMVITLQLNFNQDFDLSIELVRFSHSFILFKG